MVIAYQYQIPVASNIQCQTLQTIEECPNHRSLTVMTVMTNKALHCYNILWSLPLFVIKGHHYFHHCIFPSMDREQCMQCIQQCTASYCNFTKYRNKLSNSILTSAQIIHTLPTKCTFLTVGARNARENIQCHQSHDRDERYYGRYLSIYLSVVTWPQKQLCNYRYG